jgi:hypothetical protein
VISIPLACLYFAFTVNAPIRLAGRAGLLVARRVRTRLAASFLYDAAEGLRQLSAAENLSLHHIFAPPSLESRIQHFRSRPHRTSANPEDRGA